MSEADPADHREGAGQPENTFAHRLGGRDTLDVRCKVYALVLVVEGGALRDDTPILERIVERREFMHIDVIGCLPPTEPGWRPQFLLKVVLAQIERDNRHTVFNGRADKGVLVHLRDSRCKLHLHRNGHPIPFATLDFPLDEVLRG